MQALKRPSVRDSREYKLKEFSAGAEKVITKEAQRQLRLAESRLTKHNMRRHRRLVEELQEDTTFVKKRTKVGNVILTSLASFGSVATMMPMVGRIPQGGESKKFTVKAINYAAPEMQKLNGLHQKELRDAFKNSKKQFARQKAIGLEKDYEEEFNMYQDGVKKESEGKTQQELHLQDILSSSNTVVSGGSILEIENKDKISEFEKEVDEIDANSTDSEQKITQIQAKINQNESILIEDAIEKMYAAKGVTDISESKLKEDDYLDIKQMMLLSLEKKGILEKGQIKTEQVTSDAAIDSVHRDMVKNQKQTQEDIEKKIVQDAYLEYMAKEDISDIRKLKSEKAKNEIYDIIKEKLMSKHSKSSAEVIKDLTGEDKLKQDFELTDTIKESVEETAGQVKRVNTLQMPGLDKDKLVQRQTNRVVNTTKEQLERAIYSDDEEEAEVDDNALNLLFTLSEIKHENKDAVKRAGEKTKDEKRIHGPVSDIVDLIYRV